jgi:FkbM family methyltransferase
MRILLAGTSVGTAVGINEPEVLDVLSSHVRPGGIMYDIGANVGYFTLVGAQLVGAEGQVHAFEPVPATAKVLRGNVEMNELRQVIVHEVGVSDRNGQARFEVGHESVRARESQGTQRRSERGLIDVELVALDEMVAAKAVPPPDFVKMDIEGAEVSALRGMSAIIRHHKPIFLVEVHGTQSAVVEMLRSAGYVVSSVELAVPAELAPDFTHVLAVPPENVTSRPAGPAGDALAERTSMPTA